MGPNGWTEIEELFPVVPSYGQGMEQGWKAGWLLKRITEGDPRLYSGGANLGLAGNQRPVEPGVGFPRFPWFTPPAIPFLPDPTGEDVLPPVSSGGGVTPPEPPASSGGPTVSSGGPIGPGGPSGSTSGGPVSTSYSTSSTSSSTSSQTTSTQSTSTLSTTTTSTTTTSTTTTSTSEVFDDCGACADCSDVITVEVNAVYSNTTVEYTVTGSFTISRGDSDGCGWSVSLSPIDLQCTDEFGNVYPPSGTVGTVSFSCSETQGFPRAHRFTGSIQFTGGVPAPTFGTFSVQTVWEDTSGQQCVDGVYTLLGGSGDTEGTGTLTVSGSG